MLTGQSALEANRAASWSWLAVALGKKSQWLLTAQATQRKVGRKRKLPKLQIQECLLPNLDCQAVAAVARLRANLTAVLLAKPLAWLHGCSRCSF